MLVDDSAVIRGLFKRWLEEDPAINIIASVSNGAMAVRQADDQRLEVVVLDIEMPEMDGMTALPKILAANTDVKVIMASTLTARNADISMKALAAGAADYIPKPTSTRDLHAAKDFRRELIEKIKALGATVRKARGEDQPNAAGMAAAAEARAAARPAPRPVESGKTRRTFVDRSKPIALRPASKAKPEILAIGSSTGGPQALFAVLGYLKANLPVPVLITQHMPATFTSILADHIGRVSGAPCAEAKHGEPLVAGRIYVAPGDNHMVVVKEGGGLKLALNQDPPENFCRPAVDPMFRSVSKVFGDRALGLVLTGMGQDGYEGGKVLTDAGGTVLAQDEDTSVVWGMPGAVASGGLCSAVLPIDRVGPTVEKMLSGGGL